MNKFKNIPTSLLLFIIFIFIAAVVFIIASPFNSYGVDKKYSLLLTLFLLVALLFCIAGLNSGFKFKTEDAILRQRNWMGMAGNMLILAITVDLMTQAALKAMEDKPAKTSFEQLICNQWKCVAFEEDGVKKEMPENFKNTRVVYLLDHTVFSLNKGQHTWGRWSYNETTHLLTITDKLTGKIVTQKVLEIKEGDLIVQIGSVENRIIKLYMKSEIERP